MSGATEWEGGTLSRNIFSKKNFDFSKHGLKNLEKGQFLFWSFSNFSNFFQVLSPTKKYLDRSLLWPAG